MNTNRENRRDKNFVSGLIRENMILERKLELAKKNYYRISGWTLFFFAFSLILLFFVLYNIKLFISS